MLALVGAAILVPASRGTGADADADAGPDPGCLELLPLLAPPREAVGGVAAMTVGTGRLPDAAAAAAALSCWGIGGTVWPTSCRGVAMSPRVSRICFATMLLTFAPTDRRGFLPPAPSSRDGRARARAPPAEAIPPALTALTALVLSWAEREEEKGAPPPPLGSGVLEEEGVN